MPLLNPKTRKNGVQIFYGYPHATERPQECACTLALALQTIGQELAPQFARGGTAWATRIGVHAGATLFAGGGGGQGAACLALGDTPDATHALVQRATSGEVLLSAQVQEAAAARFVCQAAAGPTVSVGAQHLKVFRLVSTRAAAADAAAADDDSSTSKSGGDAPEHIVGRAAETRHMLALAARAHGGAGQAVFVARWAPALWGVQGKGCF